MKPADFDKDYSEIKEMAKKYESGIYDVYDHIKPELIKVAKELEKHLQGELKTWYYDNEGDQMFQSKGGRIVSKIKKLKQFIKTGNWGDLRIDGPLSMSPVEAYLEYKQKRSHGFGSKWTNDETAQELMKKSKNIKRDMYVALKNLMKERTVRY